MESFGFGSFLRNRKLESYVCPTSEQTMELTSKLVAKVREAAESQLQRDVYVEDNGWFAVLVSWIRIVACFLCMMVMTFVWAVIMVLLIPWPYERIRQGNIYGHVTGRILIWILGNPIKIEGKEYSQEKAIYICNHCSPIDVILIMWLVPTGTVGIAKKEIIWYPLFGQLYVLAYHLRIDRSNPVAAVQSLKEAARAVVRNQLSLIIFPEGTRSKDGRLLPFKKGFIHLALQSKRPIVPIVFAGTHRAWRKGSLHIRPTPLTVKFLPPIRTDNWTVDRIDTWVELVRDLYIKHLPDCQRPVPPEVATQRLVAAPSD